MKVKWSHTNEKDLMCKLPIWYNLRYNIVKSGIRKASHWVVETKFVNGKVVISNISFLLQWSESFIVDFSVSHHVILYMR